MRKNLPLTILQPVVFVALTKQSFEKRVISFLYAFRLWMYLCVGVPHLLYVDCESF